jgi:hypothetical protein
VAPGDHALTDDASLIQHAWPFLTEWTVAKKFHMSVRCLELIRRDEQGSALGLDFDIDEVLSSALRIQPWDFIRRVPPLRMA